MKAAVIFPGIGYTTDKPLLYYGRKIAKQAGYEVIDVTYGGFSADIKGSPEKMQEAFERVLVQARDFLQDVQWERYSDILFISKSIGTAVAAAYAGEKGIVTRNIFFTPVEQSFLFMKDSGIVFSGTADPWVKPERIPGLCAEKKYPLTVIKGGNHSLETGDARADLDILAEVMEKVEEYVREV